MLRTAKSSCTCVICAQYVRWWAWCAVLLTQAPRALPQIAQPHTLVGLVYRVAPSSVMSTYAMKTGLYGTSLPRRLSSHATSSVEVEGWEQSQSHAQSPQIVANPQSRSQSLPIHKAAANHSQAVVPSIVAMTAPAPAAATCARISVSFSATLRPAHCSACTRSGACVGCHPLYVVGSIAVHKHRQLTLSEQPMQHMPTGKTKPSAPEAPVDERHPTRNRPGCPQSTAAGCDPRWPVASPACERRQQSGERGRCPHARQRGRWRPASRGCQGTRQCPYA